MTQKSNRNQDRLLEAIFTYCQERGWLDIGYTSDIIILIMGALANIALLWLFLREKRPLSASQVLGVNIAVMDLLYLFMISVWLVSTAGGSEEMTQVNRTSTENSLSELQENSTTEVMQVARGSFNMFNLIGCPLLLSCMCAERYLAVVRPVLYLKMRKLEYRVVVSAVVWLITLSFCVATGILRGLTPMMIPVSFIITCLFILMLTCLCGVIRSLLQQSPALTTVGNQSCSSAPLKRKAVYNVLAVVVPAVVSYLPIIPMVPLLLYIEYQETVLTRVMCSYFDYALMFPRLGVFIGPLFYLSKARQMCLCL